MKETNTTGTSESIYGTLYGDLSPTITTYTGIKFNILDPRFDIKDIAHALSMTCRFAGHCKDFYSVAEHSILVSWLMEELDKGDPFIGLMHDAHEAYLSDVPSPFKQLLPDWHAIDVALEEKLYEWAEMPFPREQGCKDADVLAFWIERYYLFNKDSSETFNTGKFPGLREIAEDLCEGKTGGPKWEINSWDPSMAEHMFLNRYAKLQKQAGKD